MPIKPGERISPLTEFKKGQKPKNKLPIGSVTIRKHKSDQQRAWIKIAEPNVWILRAEFIWIQIGGSIPKGFVVHHLDHNALNDDYRNLALLSRGDHINHHRQDLLKAKIGLTIKKKKVTCSKCGNPYSGKAQRKNGLCDECKKESSRAIRRRYKARIRAERRRQRASHTSQSR